MLTAVSECGFIWSCRVMPSRKRHAGQQGLPLQELPLIAALRVQRCPASVIAGKETIGLNRQFDSSAAGRADH